MGPDQQLIDRFYKGECSPAEAQQVMTWLLENEQAESSDKDWSEASVEGKYAQGVEEEMLEFIQVNKRIVSVRTIPWKRLAVAASIAVVAGLSILGLQKRKKAGGTTPAIVKQQQSFHANTNLIALNAPAGHPLTIRMVDGSTVILEPGAVLRYDSVSYDKKDRVLSLEGQAVFNVAAKKDKPFSVNANGFSTTALGTSFLVAAKPMGDIRVRLYSGKVVIRRIGMIQPAMKDVYLAPGEELAYGGRDHQFLVSRPPTIPEKPKSLFARAKGVRLEGDTLVFDNAQLATVLDVLKRRYHVSIQYDPSGLSDAYFTGSVLPGDAIELILRTVTRINNLSLIAAGDGFIIK